MNFKFKNKSYQGLLYLFFLSLFLVININFAQAADFKINVGSTEWKINSSGIYKNNTKIYCSDIQTETFPSTDGFLIKNSSGTKLFLMTDNYIYVTDRDPFSSLSYPGGIEDSFILKKTDNNVLLYVDGDGLHYKDGLCNDDNYTCVDPGNRVCDGREEYYCNQGCEFNTYAQGANMADCGSSHSTCIDCCKVEHNSDWYDCNWQGEWGGGGAYSFGENTLIDTENGSKKIVDIQKGDIVKSYDEINQKIVFTEVLDTRTKISDFYYLLNFKIEVTENHEFYVDGKWIPVRDLKLGDNLFDGRKNIILWSMIKIDEPVVVYNFDTEAPYDNYFAEGILVHNDDAPACEPPSSNYGNCLNYSVMYGGVSCYASHYETSNQNSCCEYTGIYDICEGDPTDSCSNYNNSQSACVGHGCNWEINSNHPCGNGVIDSGEQCDGSNLNGQNCESQGFCWGGDLGCNPVTCQFDIGECHVTEPPHCVGDFFACEDINIYEEQNLYYDDFDLFPVTCYDDYLIEGYYTGLDGCGCTDVWACMDDGNGPYCQGGGFAGWVFDPNDCHGYGTDIFGYSIGCGDCGCYDAGYSVCVCEGTHLPADSFTTEIECLLNGYTWVE
jgi:hypothetical protein